MMKNEMSLEVILLEVSYRLFYRLKEDLKLNFKYVQSTNCSRELKHLSIQWNSGTESKLLSLLNYHDKYLDDVIDSMFWAIDWEIFKTRRSYVYPNTTLLTVKLEQPRDVDSCQIVQNKFSLKMLEGYDIADNNLLNRVDILFDIEESLDK